VQLEALDLRPDLVVLSPLSRAVETGRAFLKRRPELEGKTEIWKLSHEMAFGDWDNLAVRLCSLEAADRVLQTPFSGQGFSG